MSKKTEDDPTPANDRFPITVWTCDCGNQRYNLTPQGPVCFGCARLATDWMDSLK